MVIRDYERGLLFKKGNYIKYLKPGNYIYPKTLNYEVIALDINKRFHVEGKDISIFLKDENLNKDLEIYDVKDNEYVLHFEDEKFKGLYTSGKYAFFNISKKHSVIKVDQNNPEVSENINKSIFNIVGVVKYVSIYSVASFEKGVLFYDNKYKKILEPGIYFFWKGAVTTKVESVDLRRLQLDMVGQEILTQDKVGLRLNFVCQYKIKDILKVLEISNLKDQLYIALQLILREYVGMLNLDEILKSKQEIGNYVLQKLKDKSEDFGVEFIDAGVKDVILPGEIRDILNTVLIAEKQAQANVVMRREETASTRSLLNTAKLMEENKTLYKLKELEYLERICDKIGNVSLHGGSSLLNELNSLIGSNSNNNK
ncbi:MAG TPA: peptidase [Clostridiales bacterium]|nr:peptidase [Clostridiales bacterium]